MQERKYKRSQYIVDKSMQFKFVGLVFFYIIAFFVISMIVVYFSGWNQMANCMADIYPQAKMVEIMNSMYLRLLIGFLLLLPVAMVSAIMLSHKIAGPLVRIKRALNQLANGNYDVIVNLRKHDQLQDVAILINKLAQTLKKKNV